MMFSHFPRSLKSSDGHVHDWGGEADGIMALPSVELRSPPRRLARDAGMAFVERGQGRPRAL